MDITPTGVVAGSAASYVHVIRPHSSAVPVGFSSAEMVVPWSTGRSLAVVEFGAWSKSRRVDVILTWDERVGGILVLDGGSPDMGAANYADGGGPSTTGYELTYEGNWTGV